MKEVMEGVAMELSDCALPVLVGEYRKYSKISLWYSVFEKDIHVPAEKLLWSPW